jgi:hypothetical protein
MPAPDDRPILSAPEGNVGSLILAETAAAMEALAEGAGESSQSFRVVRLPSAEDLVGDGGSERPDAGCEGFRRTMSMENMESMERRGRPRERGRARPQSSY